MKFGVRSEFNSIGWLRKFRMDANGVHMEFTDSTEAAAQISIKEIAKFVANCVPGGRVQKLPDSI